MRLDELLHSWIFDCLHVWNVSKNKWRWLSLDGSKSTSNYWSRGELGTSNELTFVQIRVHEKLPSGVNELFFVYLARLENLIVLIIDESIALRIIDFMCNPSNLSINTSFSSG